MLQKFLVEMVLMVNVGKKNAINRREKCNMLQKSLLKKVS